jgi:chromosome segregation ATPase
MRRTVVLSLGVFEFLAALVLVGIAWQLPGPAEVHDSVGRVERVSRQTSAQVKAVGRQLHILRERRPQVRALALRLQEQMRLVADNLRSQQIDEDTLQTVSDSLGDTASGLDSLSATLDPHGLGQVGAGLGATADFLDGRVAPAAARVADQLDRTSADLGADAARLQDLVRAAPLSLKAAREIHDSLSQFGAGLERMERLLEPRRVTAMREGFQGLESSLTTGADEVERLSGYTYPLVSFDGLRPVIDRKPFWPEGEKIAAGMRKAARGAVAAGKELDSLAEDLPRLQESLRQSRKAAAATREALGLALRQQDKVEPLLKEVPEHAARLAGELPRLSADLARILRDTSRLKEVAALLRQAQRGVDGTVARWPELRKNLGRSAVLLRAAQARLKDALAHRPEYEASLRQTLGLTRTFAAALPLLTDQLEDELLRQEQSLTRLGESIDEVSATLPACAHGASRLLQTTRLLLGLVAAIFALHGGSLTLGPRLGPRPGG